jgi:hypothetical protein
MATAGFPQVYSTEVTLPFDELGRIALTVTMRTETTEQPQYYTVTHEPNLPSAFQSLITGTYDEAKTQLELAGFTLPDEAEDLDRNGFINDADLPTLPDP